MRWPNRIYTVNPTRLIEDTSGLYTCSRTTSHQNVQQTLFKLPIRLCSLSINLFPVRCSYVSNSVTIKLDIQTDKHYEGDKFEFLYREPRSDWKVKKTLENHDLQSVRGNIAENMDFDQDIRNLQFAVKVFKFSGN